MMSDSGFPNIPAGARALSDIPGRGDQGAQRGDIVALPADMRAQARQDQAPLRLAGEIIRSTPADDGKTQEIRIRTPRGDVDISVPKSQATLPAVLREGRQVNLDVIVERGGSESVTVRPARAESPPPPRTPQAQDQNKAPPRHINVEIPPATLAKVQLAQIARQEPSQSVTPAPPPAIPAGSTIRIEPLTPAQSALITQPEFEILAARLMQNVALATTISGAPAPAGGGTPGTAPALPQAIIPGAAAGTIMALPQVSIPPAGPPAFLPPPSADTAAAGQEPPIRTALPPLGSDLLSPQNLQASLEAQDFAPPFALPPAASSLQAQDSELIAAAALQKINVKVESVLPPAVQILQATHAAAAEAAKSVKEAQNPILENLRPGVLSARVTGLTDRGLPVLALEPLAGSPPQDFALQSTAPQDITQGTRITIMAQNQAIGIQAATTQITLQPAALLTPGAWPVMQEVLQTLTQNAPALAQAMNAVVPNPAGGAAQMAPAAMFFIAAIRSGDIGSWLGDKTLEVLRREGKGNLLSRLGSEGGALTRLGAEPVSQDWRGMSIPMAWQNEMQKIALYYKRDEGSGEEKENRGGNTRFLFDLSLSQMGKVQLDGLLRGTKLDLIVRTGQSFSSPMQQEMRRLYTGALEQAQMSGELSFTAKPESWVTINLKEKSKSLSA